MYDYWSELNWKNKIGSDLITVMNSWRWKKKNAIIFVFRWVRENQGSWINKIKIEQNECFLGRGVEYKGRKKREKWLNISTKRCRWFLISLTQIHKTIKLVRIFIYKTIKVICKITLLIENTHYFKKHLYF